MKDKERRQYEMLLRIRDFGSMHRGVFAGSPVALEAFESVNAAVNELAAADLQKLSARVAARADRKAMARKRLIKLLVRVSQLARVLRARRRTLPRFAMPRSSSDQGWLTLARQFARDTASFDAEFGGHGMGPTVIDRVAAAFDTSVRDRDVKRADHTAARTQIHDLITSALLDARRLDLIIDNELARDNVIRAVWKQARHVERARGLRRGGRDFEAPALPAAATVDEPTPAKVIPMAEGTPADSLSRRSAEGEGGKARAPSLTLRQVFEVGEILVPSGGPFVCLQVVKSDDSHRHVVERRFNRPRRTVVEFDPGDAGEHFDANWRYAESNHVVRSQEEIPR